MANRESGVIHGLAFTVPITTPMAECFRSLGNCGSRFDKVPFPSPHHRNDTGGFGPLLVALLPGLGRSQMSPSDRTCLETRCRERQ
jgi:hypothetical protein